MRSPLASVISPAKWVIQPADSCGACQVRRGALQEPHLLDGRNQERGGAGGPPRGRRLGAWLLAAVRQTPLQEVPPAPPSCTPAAEPLAAHGVLTALAPCSLGRRPDALGAYHSSGPSRARPLSFRAPPQRRA